MALFGQVFLLIFSIVFAECLYHYNRRPDTPYGTSPSSVPYAGLVNTLYIPNEEIRDQSSPETVTNIIPKLKNRDEVNNQSVLYGDRNKHLTEEKQKRRLEDQGQTKLNTTEESINNKRIDALSDSKQSKPSSKAVADDKKETLSNRTSTNETSVNILRDANNTMDNIGNKDIEGLSNRLGSDRFVLVPVSTSADSLNSPSNNQPNGNINMLVSLSGSDVPLFNNINQVPETEDVQTLLTNSQNPNAIGRAISGNQFIPVLASIQSASIPYNDINKNFILNSVSNQLLPITRENIQNVPVASLNNPNDIGHNVNINTPIPSNIRVITPFSSSLNTAGQANLYNKFNAIPQSNANLVTLNNNIQNVTPNNVGQPNLYALVNIPNTKIQGSNLHNDNLYVLNNFPTYPNGNPGQNMVQVYRMVTMNSAPNDMGTLENVLSNYGPNTPNNGAVQPINAISSNNNQMLLAVNG